MSGMSRDEILRNLPPQLIQHYEKRGVFDQITQVTYYPALDNRIVVHVGKSREVWDLFGIDPLKWVRFPDEQ